MPYTIRLRAIEVLNAVQVLIVQQNCICNLVVTSFQLVYSSHERQKLKMETVVLYWFLLLMARLITYVAGSGKKKI